MSDERLVRLDSEGEASITIRIRGEGGSLHQLAYQLVDLEALAYVLSPSAADTVLPAVEWGYPVDIQRGRIKAFGSRVKVRRIRSGSVELVLLGTQLAVDLLNLAIAVLQYVAAVRRPGGEPFIEAVEETQDRELGERFRKIILEEAAVGGSAGQVVKRAVNRLTALGLHPTPDQVEAARIIAERYLRNLD